MAKKAAVENLKLVGAILIHPGLTLDMLDKFLILDVLDKVLKLGLPEGSSKMEFYERMKQPPSHLSSSTHKTPSPYLSQDPPPSHTADMG